MKLTIYIVDDDIAVRDSLSLLLELSGWPTQQFESGDVFLNQVQNDWFGCVLLDLRMPGSDGLTVQRRLIERHIALPVVMVTAHGDVAAARQALKAGAVDFLEKPIDEPQLIALLRQLMDTEQQRQLDSSTQVQVWERIERLTEREQQVMQGVVEGLTNKLIAEQLDISARTVEVYRARLMDKLQIEGVPELVRLYLQWQQRKSVAAPSSKA